MGKPLQPDPASTGSTSSWGVGTAPGQQPPSSGAGYASTAQLSARGTSSGPPSSYSAYSTADPQSMGGYTNASSYGTYNMASSGGMPHSSSSAGGGGGMGGGGHYQGGGGVPASYPQDPNAAAAAAAGMGSLGMSPFFTPMPLSSPVPGSYGPSTVPPSGMVMGGQGAMGAMVPPSGPYTSSSQGGGVGMGGPSGGMMQPGYMSSSSGGPSMYSGGGMSTPSTFPPSSMMPPSYPTMGPVGAQPLPPHGPMSSLGPVSVGMQHPGLMHPMSMDPAAAQAEAEMTAAKAAQDAGACGARAHLIHFRPKLGDKLVATCPMVCLVNAGRGVVGGAAGGPQVLPLETAMLQYNVKCHISQAFVDLLLVCQYPNTWPELPCVFFLPKTTDTTITEITVNNAVRPNVQTTMVVPIEDFRKYGGKRSAVADGVDDPASKLDPELFMLPITSTAPGDRYEVRVKYFQPLQFDTETGRFVLDLPTVVPKECLPAGVHVKAVLEASVAIDTAAMGEDVELRVNYPRKSEARGQGTVSFEIDNGPDQAWPDADLLVQYDVWRDSITALVQLEPPAPEVGEGLGTFVLSVMPPGPEKSVCFPRDVVFAFDRSGSMKGEPMRYAKAALLTGLLKLDPTDRFTVVAFDHDQQWWTDCLMFATPENIRSCVFWVNDDISARGMTDIKTPLTQALRLLQTAPVHAGEVRLPLVFLLTDGCVDNEREICKSADSIIRGTPDPDAVPLITVDATNRLVDAGQLVGVGLEKPDKPQQQQQQDQQLQQQQPSSGGYSTPGQQPSSAHTSNGTATTTAVPSSDGHYKSTGSSITQPTSGGVSSSSVGSSKRLAPRVFTFGIGPYCNHYFLKRLAALGRGMNDVAFRAHAIQSSMEQMLHAAALPILSDVQLHVPGAQLRLYPDPIPDVFVGQPLLVSGKFSGVWPEKIEMTGTLPSGELYTQEVRTVPPQLTGSELPLDSIFAKSELDQLVADAWLQNNPPRMVDQILMLSQKRNIPVTGFTVALGFETTPERLKQLQGMPPEQRRKQLVKYAIGGAAGLLAVGGLATALAFGSVAATMNGLASADMMGAADLGDIVSNMHSMGDCCAGCGDCCGSCGDLCGACVQC